MHKLSYICNMDFDELNGNQLKYYMSKREIAFAHEYIIDWRASASIIKAGYTGNNPILASKRALESKAVQAYIDRIKDNISEEANISKLKIINKLMAMASTDVTAIYDDDFSLKDLSVIREEHPEIMDCIKGITQRSTKYGTETNVQFHDNRGIMQDVLKAMGWNEPEKIDHTMTMKEEEIKQRKVLQAIFPTQAEIEAVDIEYTEENDTAKED